MAKHSANLEQNLLDLRLEQRFTFQQDNKIQNVSKTAKEYQAYQDF